MASRKEGTAERFGGLEGMRAGLGWPRSGPCCGSLCSTVVTKPFLAARLKKQDYCMYSWSSGGSAPPLLVSCLISWPGKDGLDETRKREGKGRLIYPLALLFRLSCDLVKQGDDESFEVQSTPHPSPRSGLTPPPPPPPPPPSLGPAAFCKVLLRCWSCADGGLCARTGSRTSGLAFLSACEAKRLFGQS